MRRVRKEEITIDTWVKPDGLEYCLDCWRDWYLSDDRDLSASRMKLDGGKDDDDDDDEKFAYESDPNLEQRKCDNKIGEATNTVIEDLSLRHAWALKKLKGIATVWKFPQLDYMTVVQEAKLNVEIKLRRNIVTGVKFG